MVRFREKKSAAAGLRQARRDRRQTPETDESPVHSEIEKFEKEEMLQHAHSQSAYPRRLTCSIQRWLSDSNAFPIVRWCAGASERHASATTAAHSPATPGAADDGCVIHKPPGAGSEMPPERTFPPGKVTLSVVPTCERIPDTTRDAAPGADVTKVDTFLSRGNVERSGVNRHTQLSPTRVAVIT